MTRYSDGVEPARGSSRGALVVQLVLAGLLAAGGCGPDSNETGAAAVGVNTLGLSAADVTRVTVTITSADIATPIIQDLALVAGQWKGTIGAIPVGTDRTFTARASDDAGQPIYEGQATGVTITPGAPALVAIMLQQSTPPDPFRNAAPVIDSVVATALIVEPDKTVTIAVQAHDPDPGELLSYSWTATAGTFTAPASPSTVWTAPSIEGTETLTITVTDPKGASQVLGVEITVGVLTGAADVEASFNTWPLISAITAAPSLLAAAQATSLTLTVADADGDPLSFAWSDGGGDCAGSFADATAQSPTWTAPAVLPPSGQCTLAVTVQDGRGGSAVGSLTLHTGSAPTLQTGPYRVADLQAGADLGSEPDVASGSSERMVQAGSLIYFVANDGFSGDELWKTDGTVGGTVLVKDINPKGGSFPGSLVAVGSALFFTANDGTSGRELWKTDGTEAGTVMVTDIKPGAESGCDPPSATNTPVNIGGTLFFTASDGASGHALWKSDGTATGTVMLASYPFPNSYGDWLTDFNGTLFFAAMGALWTSDGTAAGTVMVAQTSQYGNGRPSQLTVAGDTLYFRAYGDDVLGEELWKSDGTAAGTVLVKDINPGSGNSGASQLTVMNGALYFGATDGSSGFELWTSDGTDAGTVMVRDIQNGASGSWPESLTAMNGTLYFRAYGPGGWALWKSDGTAAGTTTVKEGLDVGALTTLGDALVFWAYASGWRLFKSDGTEAGTQMVTDIVPGSGSPSALASIGGALYFRATDGTDGSEPWTSDGTETGTARLKNIRATSEGCSPRDLVDVGGTLYFAANGAELYRSDGTAAGTEHVRSFTALAELTAVGDTLFFVANDGAHGAELWTSDGTAAGTVMVTDVLPGSYGGLTPGNSELTAVGTTLFFAANDGTNGVQLWKSDGTEAGTVMVTDIFGGEMFPVAQLTDVGGVLFFRGHDATSGYELYKSDGTAAGTVMVKDVNPGAADGSPDHLTAVGSTLFFSANDGTTGWELWRTDGTADGTVLVKDIYPGAISGSPRQLTEVNGTLYFAAQDANNYELWKSDGTGTGTVLVKDINPSIGGALTELTAAGGALYLRVDDGTHGSELWKSDGTADGTVLVKDIFAGLNSAAPSFLTVVGSRLFFAADDGWTGTELWALAL